MTTKPEFKEATEDIQKRIHYITRADITKDEVADFYKTWAETYDNDLEPFGYNGPKHCCDLLERTLQERKDARILDAASGTGLGGKIMKERGYTNIDALDSCQEMLDKSKQYGAYTNYINAYLGKNRLPIEDGGYIGLIIGESYFNKAPEYAGNIEPRMRELQEAGVWMRIRREIVPQYHYEDNGVLFLLQLNAQERQAERALITDLAE